MAKSLRTLATQLKKNHGYALVPTFDDGVRPGTVVERRRWNDLNRIGQLTDDDAIARGDLGEIEGPTPCLLTEFNRRHELTLEAALDLLGPVGSAASEFERSREVVAGFDSPVTYSSSLFTLEDALERDPRFWERTVGQHLRSRRHYVVYRVVRARLSFLFRGTGSAGIDMKSTKLRNLKSVELSAGWSWRNEATLESKKEILVAVEMARYRSRKKKLVSWPG